MFEQEQTDALRAVEFVGAGAEGSDTEVAEVDGDLADGLGRIAVERDLFRERLGDVPHRLDRPGFVVGQHQRHEPCVGANPLRDFVWIDDPARMKRIILEAVPLGSDLAKAERFMKDQGFTCQKERNADFNERKGLDYLYCDRTEGSIVRTDWRIAIVDRNGKVSEVIAQRFLTGP